jgi:general secretion pathway protein D
MTSRNVRLCLGALLSVAAVFPTHAQPPAQTPPPGTVTGARTNDSVSLSLADDSVDQTLGLLSALTGRTFLVPSSGLPAAKYTINKKNIPKAEAVLLLETLLSMNGVAIVPLNDGTMKAVPTNLASREAPEIITGSTLGMPRSGRIATKVFQLEFLQAQQFVPAIMSQTSQQMGGTGVVQLATSNAFVVTDTITALQRIEELIKIADQPNIGTPKFIALKQGAKASDIVNKIRLAFGNTFQQQLGNSTAISADDRTNQVIVVSDPRLHPIIEEMIAKLDVKSDPNTLTEIIPLKHAEASKVQGLINTIISGKNAAAQRSSSQPVRPGLQPNLPGPQNPLQPFQPNVQPIQPGGNANAPGQQPAAQQLLTQILGIEGAAPSADFSSIVNVVNDDRSNSLLVSGTIDDVRLIKELVAKIDTTLAQVRIEVIIAEVTLNDTDISGISKLNLTVGTDTPAGAGGDRGHGTHITNFAGTIAGWDITSGIVNPLSFTAAFSDAGKRSNVKVLQAATIATSHAKKGTISVGQEIPYVANATSSITGSDTVNQSVNFKEIKLQLDVLPLIGDGGNIQMDIDQVIQDQIGSVISNGTATPQIGTRRATSTISVLDNQMIVLGGLQRSSQSNARDKLGFIYELPIVSRLLGGRTHKTERTELLLFIRPHVLKLEDVSLEANKTIEALSNKEQVKQYLENPGKPAKETLLERFQ